VTEKVLPLRRRTRIDVLRYVPSGRSLVVGGAIILAAVGLYFTARESSVFALQRIEVRGGTAQVGDEVRSLLRSEIGRSLVATDTSTIEGKVDGLPTVRSAVVDRAFPHTLDVTVVPEVPVAVLRRGAGSWLVSARGRVIRPIDRATQRTLPRIWLPPRTELQVGALLEDDPGGLAARSLAALVGSGFPQRISFVRALDGQITLGLRGGLEILLGPPIDLSLKIAIARQLLPGLALPGAGGPDYIDLAVPERPVAGRNPQPSGSA
jgi:cell division septal protein FtsQ